LEFLGERSSVSEHLLAQRCYTVRKDTELLQELIQEMCPLSGPEVRAREAAQAVLLSRTARGLNAYLHADALGSLEDERHVAGKAAAAAKANREQLIILAKEVGQKVPDNF